MKTQLSALLACPACGDTLDLEALQQPADDCVREGVLRCHRCNLATPVAHGFPLFGETRLDSGQLATEWLPGLVPGWFQEESFGRFLQEKAARGIYDAYALFQPFNESNRALLALYPALAEALAPGDVILDTWCRTGWQGEWLAALFPQQQVVSLWEGNSNVLGYAGFHHWLAEGERLPNLEVLFTHPDRPLPLASDSVALVIGLDSLHRYSQGMFLPECLRVLRSDGLAFFPHIHLTNSEPEPFFERGCTQLSGREWQQILERSCAGSDRAAFIFAEPELFDAGAGWRVESNPDTSHYNGAALIAPAHWRGREIPAPADALCEHHRLVLNPLLDIDLARARVGVAADREGLPVAGMLSRHPCYAERLDKVLGSDLAALDCEILALAAAGDSLGEIASALRRPAAEVFAASQALAAREIVFPAAVSASMARLQHFYGHLELPAPSVPNFQALWASLPGRYAHHPILMDEDGDGYDFESVDVLVRAAARWMEQSLPAGARIVLCSELCLEAYLVTWASWLTGRVIVPLDPNMVDTTLAALLEEVAPAACLGQREGFTQLDSLARDESRLFSALLEPHLDSDTPLPEPPAADAPVAILFTSGSTGRPKGVCLDQGSLLHTGHHLGAHFAWGPVDRLLALGAFHTMSGLRNGAVAAVQSAMTVVVPAAGMMQPQRLLGIARDCAVTHVSTVPALLAALAASRPLLAAQPRPEHLRQIIATGDSLSAAAAGAVGEWLDVEIASYYGLTETGGVCLAQDAEGSALGDLGWPLGAVAQVRGEHGEILDTGTSGELAIFSRGNASGYLQADTRSSVRFDDGWVLTGDIVALCEDGSFQYQGRSDDQVKNRAGEILYLQEIESLARESACVADSCCIQVDGDLRLLLVLREDADQDGWETAVARHMEECLGRRTLTAELVRVDTIARFASGKVNRSMMARAIHGSEQATTSQGSSRE
ncbi:hypothetical protein E4634_13560 [Mangrovimicrobium sediminis]|uniref:AMP-dependent synthetase/ligase domain-containing protein n=1 Tax=Mangrovimicrobium sediminis TaxID=2562682 RepID=A0A4Z0LZA6_9GAMM|nr:AMP-binding protein [Haliea sp. SAOS-164]TGD72550.1 hypothetical protein E4634_13560 [Haliea sp. SAOS-164]